MTTKPDLSRIWAETAGASNIEDPEVTVPGKFTAGWRAEIPPFENFNFLQQLFTTGLLYLAENGIPEWSNDIDFAKDNCQKGSDGNIYRATTANGPASTIVNPVGDLTEVWVLAFNTGVLKASESATNVFTAKLPTGLTDGLIFQLFFAAANTGACTLNTVDIKLPGGVNDPAANDILTDEPNKLIYRTLPSAHFELRLNNRALPVGTVTPKAGSTVPTGSLECDGTAISRTIYADLFSDIGTTYGVGDGSTTFNIPDLRGEFIRGWDNGKGTDSGRAIASSQADDFESHRHSTPSGGGDGAGFASSSGVMARSNHTNNSMGTYYMSYAGGAETRPLNIAMMFCIKY